jgi:FkbM family methyltransferase
MINHSGISIKLTDLTPMTHISDIKKTNLDLIHHQLYNIHKFIPAPPVKVDISDKHEILRAEDFHFYTFKNDTCISDSLRGNKIFEKFLVAFLSKLVDPDKNMLDVGSNIGVWSIVYSTFMKASIYAFEPQEEIFNCLTKNIILNQCKNVIPYNFALSDKKTNYLMNASYEKNDNFGAFRISSDGSLTIQSEIGDSLNLSNIGFIKMDVEGHELQALKGLSNTIQVSKPLLLIEIHMTQENCNETFQYIVSLGYKYVLKITHCDYLFFYTI